MNTALDFFTSYYALLFFGIASGVLSTFAYIPYIIDTVAGRTHPQRASWLIWSVLGSIAFFSQIYEGATSSLWFAGVQITGTIIVFVLSIRVGKGNFLSKTDYIILFAATIGLVLWYFTETAAYALAITISISLLGGVATVTKAYRDPESETLLTWVVSLIASVCAILSVGSLNLIILAYPLYLFTLYFAFVTAILLGHARKRMADSEAPSRTAPQRMSLPPLATALRLSADAVIVCAAVIFTVSWFISNSASLRLQAPDVKNNPTVAVIRENRFAAEEISAPINKPETPGMVPLMVESNHETPATGSTIVVVAFKLNVPSDNQFRALHADDPVYGTVLTQLSTWLANNNIGLEQRPPVNLVATSVDHAGTLPEKTIAERPLPIFPTDGVDLSALIFPKLTTVGFNRAKSVNRPSLTNEELQYLDSSDPFSRLTVTGENTRLYNTAHSINDFAIPLRRGTTLIAIATDGEWFKVRSAFGEQGYVHRHYVAVDAIAMNLREK